MWTKLPINNMRFMCTGAKILNNINEMPTPKRVPILGTVLSLMAAGSSTGVHKYIDKRHKKLGPYFREAVSNVNAVFVSDPDLMRTIFTKLEGKHPIHVLPDPWLVYNQKYQCKRGLLFMDGEEWLHYRRIMNKLLLRADVERWIESPIEYVAEDLVKKWRKQCKSSGFQPNLEKELYRVSLDVVLSVMLGSAYKAMAPQLNELLTRFSDEVHKIFLYTSKMYILPAKFYANLNLSVWRGFVESVDQTLSLGKQLVENICNLDDSGNGLLAKMIDEDMTQEEIIRVLTDFIIAAGDTTAFTTQWAFYLLCKNPNVVNHYRRIVKKSELEANKYMKGIIKETMRLYPAAAFLTRILSSEGELAGYNLPAGTVLIASIYTSSRDSKNFSDPLKFLPERWDKNEHDPNTIITPHATIPFAMGARSCIGRKIAMIQMREIITKVIENFNFELLNKKDVEDEMQMILKPKDSIDILITQRENK